MYSCSKIVVGLAKLPLSSGLILEIGNESQDSRNLQQRATRPVGDENREGGREHVHVTVR